MALRKLLLILSLFIMGDCFGQSPMFKLIAKRQSSCSYLLDQYSGAAAAYSLRKLDCDYAGSAIRVRRSSDNTESDIGFTSGGDLDTATLKTFVGTGGTDDGFVVTWYDQSGNGRNMTQSTASRQAKVMDNGVVYRINSLPSVYFTNTGYTVSVSLSLSAVSVFAMTTPVSGTSTFGRVFSTRTSGFSLDYQAGTIPVLRNSSTSSYGSFVNSDMRATYSGLSTTALNLISSVHTTSTLYNQLNDGTEQTYSYSLSGTTDYFYISCSLTNGSTEGITGYISEIIVYYSDKYSDKGNIKSNINTYYSIY